MKLFTTKNLKFLIVSVDTWVCFTIVLEKSEVLLNSQAVPLIASSVKKRQTEKNTILFVGNKMKTAIRSVGHVMINWAIILFVLIVFVLRVILH